MATNLISSAAAAVNAVSEASVGTATPIAAPRRSSARRLKGSPNMGTPMSDGILIDLPPRPRTLAAGPELHCHEAWQFPLFTADRPRQLGRDVMSDDAPLSLEQIRPGPERDAFVPLLLLADAESQVRGYLHQGELYALSGV